jgi:hypothetical protein
MLYLWRYIAVGHACAEHRGRRGFVEARRNQTGVGRPLLNRALQVVLERGFYRGVIRGRCQLVGLKVLRQR